MGISFKFLQCKRANPPEIESIKIRAKPLISSRIDYHTIEVPYSQPKYFDTVTQKHFTIPPTKEEDIFKMLDFYGIDKEKIYKCPECPLQTNMRALLPHLNNSTNDAGYYDTTVVMGVSSCLEYKSHGWDFKQLGKWMESLGY